MSIEDTVQQRIDTIVSEARAARERAERVREEVSNEVGERTQQALREVEESVEHVRQQAAEVRDQVQTVLDSPETAEAIRRDAEVVVGWVTSHVDKLNGAGVNVALPQDVQDAINRFRSE